MAKAEVGLNHAKFLIDMRQPDKAFVEFLRASEIVVNVIPHHKDYTHVTYDQPERKQQLAVLGRKVHAEADRFAAIKVIIENNNKRTGVRPGGLEQTGHLRTESEPANGHEAVVGQKVKPSVSPKPDKLHGKAISTTTAGPINGASGNADVLSDRFARLRMNGAIDTARQPDSRNSHASSVHSSSILMPSVGDYPTRTSMDMLSHTTSVQSKPYGPRGMLNGNAGPQTPAKVQIPNLPQEPPAAYNPARNMQTTGNIAPPRHSARSLASTTRRSSGMLSSASSSAPNGFAQSGDYFPTSNGSPGPPPRRKSVNVPPESRIGAERLFDYLQRFNILLVDFRPREEFDQGHIYHQNIICIEPFSLRKGMSAEEVQESLVVAPDNEYELFAQRDVFDLVIYYDGDTQSEEYLSRPATQRQAGLRYLHEALDDFNQERPLQRPPILLLGGVEAWEDLVGRQGLAPSNTLARVKQQGIRRRPLPPSTNGGSDLRIPKRRVRHYDPLGEDEEQSWRDRARAESVTLPPAPIAADGDGRGEGGEEEDNTNGNDLAIRDFLARFPEAGSLDRQALANQHSNRAPPELRAKVPMYPPAPPPSAYPQTPTRPAPAAPRMSYTGVSDRVVSATTPSKRSASSQLAPYIPPKYLATNLRLPRTGLVNFGNTCYMNSTLQALSATLPLSIFFLDGAFRDQLQKENWKGSKGVMPELYANLIHSLWKGDVECIRPTTFRTFCGRIARAFDNNEQQDAKEFFDFLVDCLHEDLNSMWARTPLRALTESEEAKRERMPKLIVSRTEWGRYLHRDSSFVNGLFAGQHASKLSCRTCGFTSTTYEAFSSISVEIPAHTPHGGLPTLQDCLRSYCSEEYLTEDDQWNCPRCKTTREASKRITITRAPQHLVIHFKRFATSPSHSSFSTTTRMSARKIRTPVDFPLNNLDLAPFMLAPPSPQEAQGLATIYGSEMTAAEPATTPPFTYDAYAVIRHIGSTMQSGHYVTAARDRARGCWRLYNDKFVSEFVPTEKGYGGGVAGLMGTLQSEEAYIVFYQRTNLGGGGWEGGGKI